MKVTHLLPVSLLIIACHKNNSVPEPMPAPAPAQNTMVDIPLIHLKNLEHRSLPAPYYHFDYNDSGYIIKAGFNAGLLRYDISYAGKRIQQMQCNIIVNKDRLVYEYECGNPVRINTTDSNGVLYRKCTLTWLPSRQLQKLKWETKMVNGKFTPDQTMEFSYYADGNLKEMVNHYIPTGTQTWSTVTDKFEDYDNHPNPGAFSLLHADVNRHLFLLPALSLQLNNPRKVTRTGDDLNYNITYSYTYDTNNRPLVRTGNMHITSGPAAGEQVSLQTTYTY